MILGFTGTRKGMTDKQKETVLAFLNELDPIEIHHGDCIGADKEFHDLYGDPQATCLHPCTLKDQRAYCKASVIERPRDPLGRNRDIVNSVDRMIACPSGSKDIPRGSGTWFTIRYARTQNVPTTIVFPDGSCKEYGGE